MHTVSKCTLQDSLSLSTKYVSTLVYSFLTTMLDCSQNFSQTLDKVKPLFKHFFLDNSNTVMIILKPEDSARFKVPSRLSRKLVHSSHCAAAAAKGHIQDIRTVEANNRDSGGHFAVIPGKHTRPASRHFPQGARRASHHRSMCRNVQDHIHFISKECTHPCNACPIKWVP